MGAGRVITFIIKGKPTPYVRMTQRGKWVKPAAIRYRNSKAAVAVQMRQQMKGREKFGKEPLGVKLTFCYERGADHRRDLDNEIKAMLDAANGIVWEDDRWVDEIVAGRPMDSHDEDYVFMEVWVRLDADWQPPAPGVQDPHAR